MTPLKTVVDHYRVAQYGLETRLHEIADALGVVGVGR
jgi:hypothetical protein